MTESTDYLKFEKPDGDVVVLPASNREYYEAKGYKVVDVATVQPGEMAPHYSPGAVFESEDAKKAAAPPTPKAKHG